VITPREGRAMGRRFSAPPVPSLLRLFRRPPVRGALGRLAAGLSRPAAPHTRCCAASGSADQHADDENDVMIALSMGTPSLNLACGYDVTRINLPARRRDSRPSRANTLPG